MDLPGAATRFASFKAALVHRGIHPANIFTISSHTHRGVLPYNTKTATVLHTAPQFEPKQTPVQSTEYKYTPTPDLLDTRHRHGTFVLTGELVERDFKMANLHTTHGVLRFARQLRRLGVHDALRQAGAQSGDLVAIQHFTLQFVT